jgi:tripartite-type tricarboxylate transporter receptor subunit TctC
MLSRRALLASMPAIALGRAALAQGYPSRPIRLVVPYAPGGGTDIAARLVAHRLAAGLPQPVVVDNRSGAGGNIGTQAVASAPRDGHTLLFAANSMTVNAALYRNPGFDVRRDFTPIARVASTPILLVANSTVPATTLAAFIQYVRARPGDLNHGTPGQGTPQHVAAELFDAMAGTRITHVPYRGTAPSVAGLLGGEVQLMFASVSAVEPLIREGRIRALAVTSARRSEAWPDLPAIAETLPGYEAELWYAILGPRGIPAAAAATIEAAVRGAIGNPEFARQMHERGFAPDFLPAAELHEVLLRDLDRWQQLASQTGIRIE